MDILDKITKYLNENSLFEYKENNRSKSIKKEKALELLNTEYSISKKSNVNIYRGVDGIDDDFLFVDPSKYLRKSANTDNYYTLLIDNTSSWKKYPKRSKSIICSTDKVYASTYGTLYKVYPINNAKIGVCYTNDIWSATSINNNTTFYDLNTLLNVILKGFYKYNKDDDYNMLIKYLKKVDDDYEKISELLNELRFKFTIFDMYLNSDEQFKDFVENIMNPNKCGFELKKAGDYLPTKREVWIGEPCVLVKESEQNLIYEE
jgi:hypothetical protein